MATTRGFFRWLTSVDECSMNGLYMQVPLCRCRAVKMHGIALGMDEEALG